MQTQENKATGWKQQAVEELASKIKEQGFRVFIAKRGTYGFFTDEQGSKVVSFQIDYLHFSFSGNYISKSCGTGWRITDDDTGDYKSMMQAQPPLWATNGEQVKTCSLEDHLSRYQSSSEYREI